MGALPRVVLITGCSSGIGRATAELFAAHGWTVYATARRRSSIEDLAAAGCRLLELDVTDPASCAAAVAAIAADGESIGVLVNNAGIQHLGTAETTPAERTRALFETNVFGALELLRLVLPGMRDRRVGRVITVGSMNGRYPMPGMSTYAATKHALEAYTDALRYELRPFGVSVSLIQPGMVRTPLAKAAADRLGEPPDDPAYARFEQDIAQTAIHWESSPSARLGCDAEDVAEAIVKAAEAKRPRSRYRVAASARLMLTARALLPDRAFDAVLRSQFPSPKPRR